MKHLRDDPAWVPLQMWSALISRGALLVAQTLLITLNHLCPCCPFWAGWAGQQGCLWARKALPVTHFLGTLLICISTLAHARVLSLPLERQRA